MISAVGPEMSRLESETSGSARVLASADAFDSIPALLCKPCKAAEEAATSAGDSDSCSTGSESDAAGASIAESLGSRWHPHSCAEPCKYHSKASGCKDGTLCRRCHLCPWKRSVLKSKALAAQVPSLAELPSLPASSKPEPPLALEECTGTLVYEKVPEPAGIPVPALSSLGSLGHCRGHCGPPCKHVRRKGGCRTGWHCLCCHECRWTQHSPTKSQESEQLLRYAPGQLLLATLYESTDVTLNRTERQTTHGRN